MADGAVHVAFADRTQITLPRSFPSTDMQLQQKQPQLQSPLLARPQVASAVLPDGTTRKLHVSSRYMLTEPLRSHLEAALEFQEWVSLSPAGRMELALGRDSRARCGDSHRFTLHFIC